MLSGAVVNRYAHGLLAFAQSHNVIDELDSQFAEVASALQASAQLRDFLANPVVKMDLKLSIIDQVLSGGLRQDLRHFIGVLLRRGRGSYIAAVAQQYHRLVDELHGRLAVEIETAQPLTQEQTDRIVSQLAQVLQKQVEPQVRLNTDLIAGYRVQVGNRVLDATTSGALAQFSRQLLAGATGKEVTR